MPIYEYDCPACRRPFEQLVRNGDPVACPDCGSTKVAKRFSVFGASTVGAPADAAPPSGCRAQGGRCGCA